MCRILFHGFIAVLVTTLAAVPGHAQWAVVDAPAIVQLVQEVKTMEDEVQTARDQLTQAKQTLDAMTGGRGMELLLAGTPRNYLPVSWPQLMGTMQGAAPYPGMTQDVRNAVAANAVLSAPILATFSAADQQHLIAGREASALQQALAQQSLKNASGRFASLQALIDAISGARDQKAILDLQARIGAELGMLQNEHTKLQILHQATQAQMAVNGQQEREQIVAGHGRFETRFQPAP